MVVKEEGWVWNDVKKRGELRKDGRKRAGLE